MSDITIYTAEHLADFCEDPGFWGFVAATPVTDDPRGDFIADTRVLLSCRKDPSGRIAGNACHEARVEYRLLRTEYETAKS